MEIKMKSFLKIKTKHLISNMIIYKFPIRFKVKGETSLCYGILKNFKKTITCTQRRPRLKTIRTHSWMRTHILLGLNIMEEATKRREDLKQLWIRWRKIIFSFSKDSKSKGILSLGSRCFKDKQTLILQRLKA